MIDHVGGELAGRCLRLHTGDELAARRTHHLDLNLREALVEGVDDLLFNLGEVRSIVDELALLLRSRNQFWRTKFLLRQGWRGDQRDGETRNAGYGNEFSVHKHSSLGSSSCAGKAALSRTRR